MNTTDWFEVHWSNVWVSLYIHPIKVVRETDHTIFSEGGGKIRKSTKRSRFFRTFDEAKTFALKSLDNRIALLEEQKNQVMLKKPKS